MTDLTPLLPLAAELIAACTARGLKIATAESCTGGLIAGALTEIAGSSAVVDRGFVTYSNGAKTELLGVPAALIVRVGGAADAALTADGGNAHRSARTQDGQPKDGHGRLRLGAGLFAATGVARNPARIVDATAVPKILRIMVFSSRAARRLRGKGT